MDELNEILKNFMCELEKRCPASPSIFKLWFGDFKLIYLDEKKAVFTIVSREATETLSMNLSV